MNIKNPLYKNQGIHVLSTIFTIEKGRVKVLLIKRSNEPYKDYWALVGGAVYNNETLDNAMLREIKEKTYIDNINIYKANIFDKVDRSPLLRMLCISYIGIVDSKKVNIKKITDMIVKTNILKNFYSGTFTIPELQKTYEIILEKKLDRRNFRKKILNLLEGVNKEIRFDGSKPALLYRFKDNIKIENVF